ncbi:MAG: hypothetical protein M0R06_11465 [Sphaerochaeta sp.]|jgi:hypothetical protein|nr:hypothetical protein [Sphaerochaeta sp.]
MSKEPYVRSRSNDFTLEQPVEPTCPECGQLLHTDWKQFAHNYLQDTLLDPRLELGLAICKKCGQGTPADLQPERQVSRDFDTIEPEPEMPLITEDEIYALPHMNRYLQREDKAAKDFAKDPLYANESRLASETCSAVLVGEKEGSRKQRDADMVWFQQHCKACADIGKVMELPEAHDSAVASKAVKDAKEALECAEYAFLHPASNQEFALNAVQQALAHIRDMAGKE